MRVIVKPSLTPNLHIDITNALVSTIAAELARAQGGNDVLNWLEAERVLQDLVGSARYTPREQTAGMDSDDRHRRRRRTAEEPEFAALATRSVAEEDAVPMSATRG